MASGAVRAWASSYVGRNCWRPRLQLIRTSDFGFLSAFELRISDFLAAYSDSTENSEEPDFLPPYGQALVA
jgi:hypothetical protein